MFDPQHIGSLIEKDVLAIGPAKATRCKGHLFAVIMLEEKHHAVRLAELNKQDQVVADRLKYLCNIKPMHTVSVTLPFAMEYDQKRYVETTYAMFATPYTIVDSNHTEMKLQFVQEETLHAYEQRIPRSMWSEKFRLELTKIILFRYIVGTEKNRVEDIIVRNSLPLSTNETFLGNHVVGEELFAYLDASCLQKARDEVTRDFHYDAMHGIVLQTGQNETDVYRKKPKRPLRLKVKRLIQLIEERVDIVSSATEKQLLDSIRYGVHDEDE